MLSSQIPPACPGRGREMMIVFEPSSRRTSNLVKSSTKASVKLPSVSSHAPWTEEGASETCGLRIQVTLTGASINDSTSGTVIWITILVCGCDVKSKYLKGNQVA